MLVQHRKGEEGVLILHCTSTFPWATVPSPESHPFSRFARALSLTVPWPASGRVMKLTEGFQGLRAPGHLDRTTPSGWPGRLGPAHP